MSHRTSTSLPQLDNPVTQATALSSNPPDSSTPTTSTTTMPLPNTRPLSLTLILAATPSLGIGKNGALPWPMLKKEMGYFARVTKRVPTPTAQGQNPASPKRVNAVIMGRKTWESIPPNLRPLKDRLNVVLTRDVQKLEAGTGTSPAGPVVFEHMRKAIDYLRSEDLERNGIRIERAFVIGGASVYEQALGLKECDKVLLTKIKREYECDTFFPVDLDGEGGWKLASRERLQEFVGEDVEVEVEEKEVKFEFLLYEKGNERAV